MNIKIGKIPKIVNKITPMIISKIFKLIIILSYLDEYMFCNKKYCIDISQFYKVIRLYSNQKLATELDRRIGRRTKASSCPRTSMLFASS